MFVTHSAFTVDRETTWSQSRVGGRCEVGICSAMSLCLSLATLRRSIRWQEGVFSPTNHELHVSKISKIWVVQSKADVLQLHLPHIVRGDGVGSTEHGLSKPIVVSGPIYPDLYPSSGTILWTSNTKYSIHLLYKSVSIVSRNLEHTDFEVSNRYGLVKPRLSY